MLDKSKVLVGAFFIIVSLLTLSLYAPVFSGYFFQDDWFTFFISQARNFGDFLTFFKPRSDVIYYRPLGMQVYFLIMYRMFGFNSTPFHAVALIFHLVNAAIIFLVVKALTKNLLSSLLTSFFYTFAGFHLIPFYWASTVSFILGVTWYMLSFLFFVNQDKAVAMRVLCFFFFIVGLLTNELIITLPFTFLLYDVIIHKKLRSPLLVVLCSLLILPYFFLRFYIGRVPLSESYQPSLTNLILPLRAYILWLLNWPEEIGKQFVGPLIINPIFIKDFARFFSVLLANSFLLLVVCFFGGVIFLKKVISQKAKKEHMQIMTFGLMWFGVTLIPLLLFPRHTFPYYLSISSVGFYMVLTTLITQLFTLEKKRKVQILLNGAIITLLVVLWYVSARESFYFNILTHWAPKRSRITRVVLGELKRAYPTLPKRSRIIFPRDSLLNVTFNDQRAIQLLYNDITLITEYTEGKDEEREKFIPKNDKELIQRFAFTIVP